MRFLFSFLLALLSFNTLALACKPGTIAKFYDCGGALSVSNETAKKAQEKLNQEMAACTKDCCIKKTGNKIAEQMNCKVSFSE